ncbi:MAG: hypothetical protein Q4P72_02570 [Eubacteriales bacterium]|nr:hypothetical protein [Eubacteriales bacterium]
MNKWFIASAVLVLAAIGLVVISNRIHFSLMAEALYWTLTICLFAIGFVFFASALRMRSLLRNQGMRDEDH